MKQKLTMSVIFAENYTMTEYIILGFFALTAIGANIYTVKLFLKKLDVKESLAIQYELKKQRNDFFLPNRVDAYQRVILYLERIHPANLVLRLNQNSMSAIVLQTTILKTIREEYDHNVAQQMFISSASWDLMKQAKEETIKIVNVASGQMEQGSSSLDYSTTLLNLVADIKPLPSEIAIKALKDELQSLFWLTDNVYEALLLEVFEDEFVNVNAIL